MWKPWQIAAASVTGLGAVGAALFWPRRADAMAAPHSPRYGVTIGNATMEGRSGSRITESSQRIIGYTTGHENSHPPAGIAIFDWDNDGNPLDFDGAIIGPGAVLNPRNPSMRSHDTNVANRDAAIVSTGNGNVSILHPGTDLAPV